MGKKADHNLSNLHSNNFSSAMVARETSTFLLLKGLCRYLEAVGSSPTWSVFAIFGRPLLLGALVFSFFWENDLISVLAEKAHGFNKGNSNKTRDIISYSNNITLKPIKIL